MRKKYVAISVNISVSNFIAKSCFTEICFFLRGEIPSQKVKHSRFDLSLSKGRKSCYFFKFINTIIWLWVVGQESFTVRLTFLSQNQEKKSILKSQYFVFLDSRVQACVSVILQTNGAKTLACKMLSLKLYSLSEKGQWLFFFTPWKAKSSFSHPRGGSGLSAIHPTGKQEQREGKDALAASVHDLCFVKLN